jgi:ABC-2 type transport system permease protein
MHRLISHREKNREEARLKQILALIRKEITAIWRDKKSRFILIGPPLIQLFVFAFAATLDVKHITIGIVNRDNGEQGFELTELFRGSTYFKKVVPLEAVSEIAPFIDNQVGAVALSIDEEFSRRLDASETASLQLILDGRKCNTAQIIAGYCERIVDEFSAKIEERNEMKQRQIVLTPRNWFNPNLLYPWFTLPGLLVTLTMVEALILTSLSVARERELGTMDQLLVSPLDPMEILIGKTAPAMMAGLGIGTVFLLAIVFIFQVPFNGSLFFLYLSLFIYLFSIIGAGLFISTLCATQQQAILGSFLFLTPAVLLSGFATPIDNMPGWFQYATYLNPARYFMIISRGIFLKDLPLSTLMQNLWPMALLGAASLSGAAYFFKKRLR